MTKKQDNSGISKKTSVKKWADAVTINDNSNQRGIELRFNAEPSPKLQPKLRAMGFRHSKSQVMWYGENTQQAMEFARKVETILPSSPEGPDLFLSPTFDAVKTNIEKKEFSYVMITLKDGQTKSYIVFEPSKPKAEVIAGNFALETFGDKFLALAAKPRLHTKEARVLFDEGKIIFPEGQQLTIHKSSSIKGLQKESLELNPEIAQTPSDTQRETERLALDKFYKWATLQEDENVRPSNINREQFEEWFKNTYPKLTTKNVESIWQSHQRILKSLTRLGKSNSDKNTMQPYSSIYSKLLKIIPNLIEHIREGKTYGKSEKGPDSGLMSLNYDFIREDKNGNYIIALSHYFEQNGDMVADPDMQIRIFPEQEVAEAMTFQDQFGYKEVYREKDGKEYVDLRRKKDLNQFLKQWLTNLINQGHKIDLSQVESEETEEIISDDFTETRTSFNQDFQRQFTSEEEKEIIEQFLALGFQRPFSAQEAFDQQYPVIDVAFRYDTPTEYFTENIEEPNMKKVQKLNKELKELKGKGTNEKREKLKEQMEELTAQVGKAERLINNEADIFNDDLFQIILDKAKEKSHYPEGEDEITRFREYVMNNILDNRAIENYHRQPLNELVDELIGEYFNESKVSVKRPSGGTDKANATDLKSDNLLVPNVLVPSGTTEPFYSHVFRMYDMKEILKNNFPHLLKLNDTNLDNASPIALFELMQFSHPSEYGIDVSRGALITEFEKRGKSIFKAIGYPTDDNYPYANLYLGYESIEPLKEMLFDNNKDGDEWWAIAENARPIADAKKAIKLVEKMIEKEEQEMKTYLNPKTGKPKLEYKQQASDIEHTIENLQDSKEVLQHYLDNPSTAGKEEIQENEQDPLANDNGVYTAKTAGNNFELIKIPIPKGAQYEASIAIVRTSNGDYKFGMNADKKFGDSSGTGFAPSIEGVPYSTKEEALTFALKQHELRLEVLLSSKDSILNNEEKKNKQLNMALKAVKEFAEEKGITLDSGSTSSGEFIKGLEAFYWTKEDEEDESYPFKIMIEGKGFHAVSLLEYLLEEVRKLSLEKQIEIVDQVSKEFKASALNDYTTDSGSTIRDGGIPLKMQVIHEYLLDLSNEKDFFNPQPKKTILGFLMDTLINKQDKLVDKPATMKTKTRPVPKAKKQSQFDLNKEIEIFIDKKDKDGNSFNEEEKNYIRQYTGSGGLLKEGATGRGTLYEYYTPELVVKKMWEMAYHYGYDGGSILEPSVGTGNFLKYAPKDTSVFGYETNHYSARVVQILYPSAHIQEKAFESVFFAGNVHLKNKFENPAYSLVIGNPPYGEFTGKYAGMGEKQYTGATEYDQYFILRGLDLLKKGGLLVFLIPSSFITNQSKFNKVKERIAMKADLVDLYRLPTRIFETTDIGTDIIVLRKTND